MKPSSNIVVLLGAALLLAPAAALAQAKPKPAPPTQVLADERGKFRLLFDGQPVGTEEFSIAPSGSEWLSRGTVTLKVPGGEEAKVTGELRITPAGLPLDYTWSSHGQKKVSGMIKFDGTTAKMELRSEGSQPFIQEFQFDSPKVVILDNNLYHQYGLLARLYDWNAKGAQIFSVLIPQDLTPGTITVEWAGPLEIDGVKTEMLHVRSADNDIELYVSAGQLVRLIAPTAKVEVRRE